MSIRPVKRVIQSKPTIEGAGVHLRRAFGFGDTREFDPFLLFDDFRNDIPEEYLAGISVASASRDRNDHVCAGRHRRSRGQPWKSRFARGRRRAMDDRGKRDHSSGNAQRRSAREDARLPALGESARRSEDDDARYQDVSGKDIPEVVDDDGTRVRVICGSFWGATGPVDGIAADPRYLDVSIATWPSQDAAGRNLPPRVRVRVCWIGHVSQRLSTPAGHYRGRRTNGFGSFTAHDASEEIGNRSLILFDRGDEVTVQAGEQGIRFLLVSGKPLEEPVRVVRPIVMNTQEELRQAVAEIQQGTFIKHP